MAATMAFEFDDARKKFRREIERTALESPGSFIEQSLGYITAFHGTGAEKKPVLDQALREAFKDAITGNKGCETYKQLINFAIEAAMKDTCSPSTPFMMLADIFDMLTLDQCQDVFNLVEDKVSVWKSETFYDAGKNYLLRMCNDLIRRLSKSQNTVFCGRIQLFLSRLFPLSEKSALNLMSQFNLENVTIYNTSMETVVKTEPVEKMEVEEGEMEETPSVKPIDYNLYRKFWSLQDYFRKPTQCYDKVAWKTFLATAEEVLKAFESCKLDDLKSQRKRVDQPQPMEAQTFFAKYLTSEKLLDLQLSDSNFRRSVLVQFLITFQYLNATVKFKSASHALTEEQSNWLKQAQDRVFQLLRETPPDGSTFASTVEHILQREETWNSWKNEGCPSYERERPKDSAKPRSRPRKRRIGDQLQMEGSKVIRMGNAELTRLWNLNPDNMEACKSEKRVFLPSLEEFFAEAIEQADPEAQVEAQYKLVNNPGFQWKALRLLAATSPHFFNSTNQLGLKLPAYLEMMISKIAKELPSQNADDMKTGVEDEEDNIKDAQDEEDLKQPESEKSSDVPDLLTKDMIAAVAGKLGDSWKKLGQELKFPEDDLAYFESSADGSRPPGVNMITVWQEEDPDEHSVGALQTALQKIGLSSLAASILG